MKQVFLLLGCLTGLSSVFADEFFTAKIEPLLKQRCYECHSHEKKMKGGLTLDSKSGWEQGIKCRRRKNYRRRRSRCWRSG
jgi:Planctomycete cytochrome C